MRAERGVGCSGGARVSKLRPGGNRACPFHVIWFDEGGKAWKCDLCGGEPACVRYCILEAIEYRDAAWKDFEVVREHVEEVCE